MPSKRRVSMMASACHTPFALSLKLSPNGVVGLLQLARILHRLLHVELDVPQLPVPALDLADAHVLHDVARLRIDEHRAARAFEELALHRGQQRVAAACA